MGLNLPLLDHLFTARGVSVLRPEGDDGPSRSTRDS